MEQMDLFEFMEDKCFGCLFWEGTCKHQTWDGIRCEDHSFFVKRENGKCPTCRRPMQIKQSMFGSDSAYCKKDDTGVIFRNKGSRHGYLDAWREGLIR